MRKLASLLIASAWMLNGVAAEPTGYYTSCEGYHGQALLSALSSKIASHTNVGYDGLWNVYKDSDMRPDGTLWDIYTTKAWPASFSKCGNYKLIGDCVNREHSLPKSWWGKGTSAQYSDAYHLYPTDGKVNGQRSNFPYGECSGGKRLPNNGNVRALGRLGSSTFPGYSGTVFEPDDEYKGDLARTYFYMATAYNSQIGRWTEGNGNQFLAGNSYPVFKTWSLELLLKWHRQDPVSQKEIDRNEGIYRHQKNRNPYIDHPELVEYIWGTKNTVDWTLNATADPEIVSPTEGTVIAVGTTATGVTRSRKVAVKGASLTEAITLTVTGSGFSVSPTSVSAADANKGTEVTVSYRSTATGNAGGQLILRSGSVTRAVTLTASAVDGIPAGPAVNISDTNFDAVWSNIDGENATYTLTVSRGGSPVEGYPKSVSASAESYTVIDLEPETAYTYTVSNGILTSDPVAVTTLAPIPSIQFLFDGDLEFFAEPGQPSEVAEILADIENIPGDITLTVTAPFQLSLDKADWKTQIVLAPGQDRFYMRMFGSTEGEYSTTLLAEAQDFTDDFTDIDGTIGVPVIEPTFIEDFEKGTAGSYDDKEYQGSACKWLTDAYITNADPAYSGDIYARMNKDKGGHLTMLEDKANGMGVLTFMAKCWDKDKSKYPADITVSVSSDHGTTWEEVGKVTISADDAASPAYRKYSVSINRRGSLRMKMEQSTSARTLIDDIALADCRTSGIEEAMEAEYHSWDAYCRNGRLVLESREDGTDVAAVYSMDGVLRHTGAIALGTTEITVAPGLYLVVVRDFTRTVLVK